MLTGTRQHSLPALWATSTKSLICTSMTVLRIFLLPRRNHDINPWLWFLFSAVSRPSTKNTRFRLPILLNREHQPCQQVTTLQVIGNQVDSQIHHLREHQTPFHSWNTELCH